jgi:hypothetical protein
MMQHTRHRILESFNFLYINTLRRFATGKRPSGTPFASQKRKNEKLKPCNPLFPVPPANPNATARGLIEPPCGAKNGNRAKRARVATSDAKQSVGWPKRKNARTSYFGKPSRIRTQGAKSRKLFWTYDPATGSLKERLTEYDKLTSAIRGGFVRHNV